MKYPVALLDSHVRARDWRARSRSLDTAARDEVARSQRKFRRRKLARTVARWTLPALIWGGLVFALVVGI